MRLVAGLSRRGLCCGHAALSGKRRSAAAAALDANSEARRCGCGLAAVRWLGVWLPARRMLLAMPNTRLVSMVRGGSWHGSRTAVRLSEARELCICGRVLNRHARACALALCAEGWELRLVRASLGCIGRLPGAARAFAVHVGLHTCFGCICVSVPVGWRVRTSWV